MKPFKPFGGCASTTLAVTQTSANVAIPGPEARGLTLLISNVGSAWAYIRTGESGVTADTAAGMPIGPGTTQSLDLSDSTHLAAICATGQTTTLYLTPGEGM